MSAYLRGLFRFLETSFRRLLDKQVLEEARTLNQEQSTLNLGGVQNKELNR